MTEDTQRLLPGSKDWCDVVLAMIQSAIGRFNSRRQVEWRFAFGLWAVLLLAISRADSLPAALKGTWIIGFLGLIAVLHAVWEGLIHQRSRADREEGIALDKLLRKYLGPDIPDVRAK